LAYKVRRSADTDRDLDEIFEFLVEAALDFGESIETAHDRASSRLVAIERDIRAIGAAPHQGTLRPHMSPGLRNVTKGRAVIYFEVDDAAQIVHVLAVFYGGQDHRQRMLARLLGR
jgi:plasmid stabilization system protein ParE